MSRTLAVKIRYNKGSIEYNNKIHIEDFKKLALFFSDLENYGAKIEKAFEEFKKMKYSGKKEFPW